MSENNEKDLKAFAAFVLEVEANGNNFQYMIIAGNWVSNRDCDCTYLRYEDFALGRLRIKFIPPTLKRVPLTRRDITPMTLFREKEDTETEFLIVYITAKDLRVSVFRLIYDSDNFMNDWERSDDNGLTWHPCYKEITE